MTFLQNLLRFNFLAELLHYGFHRQHETKPRLLARIKMMHHPGAGFPNKNFWEQFPRPELPQHRNGNRGLRWKDQVLTGSHHQWVCTGKPHRAPALPQRGTFHPSVTANPRPHNFMAIVTLLIEKRPTPPSSRLPRGTTGEHYKTHSLFQLCDGLFCF